jgi:murein DD-endopeptidase MepM/ murein hydrolase activator NlpD
MIELFLLPIQDPWVPPIQPMIIERYFEPPPTPYSAGNRGVDIRTEPQTPIRAPQDGIVHFSGKVANIGTLSINHNNLKTTFTPIDSIVKTGQFIKRNQIIGYVSTTGSHCKPQTCLHWGLVIEKRYLNPLSLFNAKTRLLPLFN